jgi:hypothetical protein
MGSIISGLCNQTIDRISSVTTDAYGDKTKSTVWENIPCRWELSQSRTLSPSAEIQNYTARAWLYPEYEGVEKTYIVTKEDEDYHIMKIEKHYSLEGELDHIVLVLE